MAANARRVRLQTSSSKARVETMWNALESRVKSHHLQLIGCGGECDWQKGGATFSFFLSLIVYKEKPSDAPPFTSVERRLGKEGGRREGEEGGKEGGTEGRK